MEEHNALTFTPVEHPNPQVRQVGFDLEHPYVERCWSAVVGPSSMLLLRLSRVAPDGLVLSQPSAHSLLVKLLQSSPDCMVITDLDGAVVMANASFVQLVQLASEEQVRGESLGRWLGRTGVELNVLIATLRQRGSVRLFPTTLRSDQGVPNDVEISAAMVSDVIVARGEQIEMRSLR